MMNFSRMHFKPIDGLGAKVLLFELLPNQLHKKLDALTGRKDKELRNNSIYYLNNPVD